MSIVDTKRLITAAKPIIAEHEGERLEVYRDSLGIPTIGIGFNLFAPGAPALCAACGVDYRRLQAGQVELTPEQSHYLYEQAAIGVVEWLAKLFPAYFTYTENRQIALLDMGYNLGETRFRGFRRMISAVLAGNWTQAAAQALRSEWATQVGGRADEDSRMLIDG